MRTLQFVLVTFNLSLYVSFKRSEPRGPNSVYSNTSQNGTEHPMTTLSWSEVQIPAPSAPPVTLGNDARPPSYYQSTGMSES